MRRALRLVSFAFLLIPLGSLPACTAATEDAAASESDFTEGSVEARAVLALVNDPSVTSEELASGAHITHVAAENIVARRDESPIETLRQLDDVREVGPATIRRLYEYAKRKGLAGGDVEVVFSPQPMESSHLARTVREIDSAQSSIDIAMYSYSDSAIAAALGAAVRRGVHVRFVFNDAGPDARLSTLAARAASTSGKIEASGVDVRFVNKVMHHKFMIVDGPRDDLAKAKTARLVTGSANWSNSAATRFDENTLFIKNAEEMTLRFQREFDLMWAHSRDFEGRSPALGPDPSAATIDDDAIPDDPDRGVFFTSQNFTLRGDTTFSSTGTNTVADALVAAIASAKKSVHLASCHLRSRPVSEALMAKKKSEPGLDIRVYLDGQEYLSRYSHEEQVQELEQCLEDAGDSVPAKLACSARGFLFSYQVLWEAGIDLRYKYYAYRWDHGYAPQMHDKYMIVDGTTVFTGSYNLSDNAEHGTFENMTMWTGPANAALAAAYEANFETIWKTGRDEGRLAALLEKVDQDPVIPIVFDPMALSWDEVTDLKRKIRDACPTVDSTEYRRNAGKHFSCKR